MTFDLTALLADIDAREGPILSLLADLVNIDSPSGNAAGLAAMRARLGAELSVPGVELQAVPTDGGPDALFARYRPAGLSDAAPAVLLLGHMDTVFPRGEAARRPFRVQGGRALGPGVADMKGGLALNTHVLLALARAGAPVPVSALFTVDEETGSSASRPVIEAAAVQARAVFNGEPGRINGNVVDGRRGGSFFRVELTGRAAHAGLNPEDGHSAITELAHKILAWTRLSSAETGVSVSVGLIDGGQAVNVVAPQAAASIDLRFADLRSGVEAEAAIRAIAERGTDPAVTAEVTKLGGFLPMRATPGSDALTRTYLAAAADEGLTLAAQFTPACSDAGIASALGRPTLCGCGPVGGLVHHPDEFVETATILPRARTLARAVLGA